MNPPLVVALFPANTSFEKLIKRAPGVLTLEPPPFYLA